MIYAIGDIHGQLDMLRAAHDRIEADRARMGARDAPVVHLGDLGDRGPDTAGVIGFLMEGIAGGAPWIVLKGNHDRIFADQADLSREPEVDFYNWCAPSWGGRETVASYGVGLGRWGGINRRRGDFASAVPAEHLAFMAARPVIHETDAQIFVHAGIRPGLPLGDQIEDDMIWIRGEFLHDPRDHGRLVVHGHTPVREAEHRGNRLNLDTGAGYGRPITAAAIEGRRAWALGEGGRVELVPR